VHRLRRDPQNVRRTLDRISTIRPARGIVLNAVDLRGANAKALSYHVHIVALEENTPCFLLESRSVADRGTRRLRSSCKATAMNDFPRPQRSDRSASVFPNSGWVRSITLTGRITRSSLEVFCCLRLRQRDCSDRIGPSESAATARSDAHP